MKQRKKLVTIVTATLVLLAAACSSPLIYTSVWQDKPVTIDGKAKEWKIPLDYYDDKTKLNFSISNDQSNIYFCVRATEDETQKGIIHSGLLICIDTTGGTKNQLSLQFPIIERSGMSSGSSRHSQSSESDPSQSDETAATNMLKRQYSGTTKQIKLAGFPNAISGLAEVPNISGINVCLNWDTNNIMIYEVSIPFSAFYKATLSPSDTNKVLGVSFIITVTPKNNSGIEHGGSGGGSGGGMGGGGMGGGMHGGGGGHGGGGHGGGGSSSPELLAAHIKFRLAAAASK